MDVYDAFYELPNKPYLYFFEYRASSNIWNVFGKGDAGIIHVASYATREEAMRAVSHCQTDAARRMSAWYRKFQPVLESA